MVTRRSLYPGRLALGDEAEGACAFSFTVSKEHWRSLLHAGLWWIVPIGHRRDQLFGIRIVPGRPLAECPVVCVEEGQVLTIVSRPAYFMPYLIWPGTVLALEWWDHPLRAGEGVWSEFRAVHTTLGGVDNLEGIRSVLADPKLGAACVIGGPVDSFAESYPEVRMRIDTAAETVEFFRFLGWAVVHSLDDKPLDEAPKVSIAGSCWAAATASAALSVAQLRIEAGPRPERPSWTRDDYDRATREAAWQLLRQPAGLDCFQQRYVSYLSHPTGSSEQMITAARLLTESPKDLPPAWRKDHWWPAIACLAEEGDRYGGLAHMDVANALAADGRREEAFYALTSAAYWFSRTTEQPNPDLASAAQLLAGESDWTETTSALVGVAERINDALPRPRARRAKRP